MPCPQVMGAPLQGSPLRAFVQTGGHVYLKGMRPKLRTRRMQMMFPLEGPARKGEQHTSTCRACRSRLHR